MDNSRKMILGESPGELTRETRVKFYPCIEKKGRSAARVLEGPFTPVSIVDSSILNDPRSIVLTPSFTATVS